LNKLQLARSSLRKPKLLELLKPVWPLAMATMLIACGQVVEAHNAIHARDAAMEAATAKMIVTQGNDIAGHSQYLALGKVRGHCLTGAQADDIIASGDNLKEAAYRKYGSSVNALVDASAVHINDDYTPEAPPDSTVGHYDCEGTAVHFTD
jgi:hypothetical protein